LPAEHLQVDGLVDKLAGAQRHRVCIGPLASRIIRDAYIGPT
jgi:hypothetical protein